MKKILVVNFEMGNLRSVKRAIEKLGCEANISSLAQDVMSAEKIIIPGVGHFAAAVQNIKRLGLWDALNKRVLADKVPTLGICLGMQLMCSHSDEGNVDGFGWIKAKCSKFEFDKSSPLKVPQIGWNTLDVRKSHAIFDGLKHDDAFYFLHSYAVYCDNEEQVIAESVYGTKFHSAVAAGNIVGVQFHPEKSHEAGKKILHNFITQF